MKYEPEPRPLPFRPSEISYDLHQVENIPQEKWRSSWDKSDNKEYVTPRVDWTVTDPEARFRAHPAGKEWIEDQYGQYGAEWCWESKSSSGWRAIPHHILTQVFTFEECVRFWFTSVIMSDLGERFIKDQHFLIWKIANSHWRYGSDKDWNLLVEHLDGLKRLTTDLPDFEVRITHSSHHNEYGWTTHEIDGERLYLDGTFGLLMYYKGKHVWTCGFTPAKTGILVAQVQLREEKGNRFLFQLPKHQLDISLEILGNAFGKDKLWLVEGQSAALTTAKNYGKLPGPKNEILQRIEQLYNRPLADFERLRNDSNQYYQRNFIALKPLAQQVGASP